MGIFGRRTKRPAPTQADLRQMQHNVVQVHFREIGPIDPSSLSPGGTYSYLWTLPEPPRVGQWVNVPGGDGRAATARIWAIGPSADSRGMVLASVLSVIPEIQVRDALTRNAKKIGNYFDHARKAVGLPIKGRLGTTFPEHYPQLPPLTADRYTTQEADYYGRVWWRLYKQAEESSRPSDEVRAYQSAAMAWFRRRDKLTGKS